MTRPLHPAKHLRNETKPHRHAAMPDPKRFSGSHLVVTDWPIDRVVPYARNPRRNAGAVAKVAASIKEFGWRAPLVVDEEGVLLAGHTRLKAAQSLGMSHVPVHVATGLTPNQAKAYRIADNRVGELAEWDTDLLALEMSDLNTDGYDMAFTGFDNTDELTGRAATPFANDPFEDVPDESPAPDSHHSDRATVPLSIVLSKQDYQRWARYKAMIGVKRDVAAFAEVLDLTDAQVEASE